LFCLDIRPGTFYQLIKLTCNCIRQCINPIKFPFGDINQLNQLATGFMKYSHPSFTGTVAAADGVVFQIERPTAVEADFDVIL